MKSALCVSLRVAAIILASILFAAGSDASPSPLTKSQLLALVAGEVYPEGVVVELQSRGLSFTPDEKYKSLLKNAGADDRVLAAVASAKISPRAQVSPADSASVLEHLSTAGQEIKAGQPDAAIKDLNAVLATGSGTSAAGFVMGMILFDKGQYEEAAQIYSQIQTDDPNFPQIHTRLSLIYDFTDDPQNGLREAKTALAENSQDPSAHLYAAKALEQLDNLDAAKLEIQEAIRCKPDYANAYLQMGLVLASLKDYDGAIAQYNKATNLDPKNVNAHYDLGIAYHSKGDDVSAIREYREAKRLDPKRLDVRQNLSVSLSRIDPAAAVTEFRELAALAPDWPLCHQCLAGALLGSGRLDEAEAEYHTALKLDPSSPGPHIGLARLFEARKQYDKALAEYRAAQVIDDNDDELHISVGHILMTKKDFSDAATEFQRAKELNPMNCSAISDLGEAYEASGRHDASLSTYREGLSLCPKDVKLRLNLAAAFERKGDWVSALNNYHQASLDEPPVRLNVPQYRYDPQGKYEAAQKRFAQHLADLRSAGKSSQADALEASLKASNSAPNLDVQYHDVIQTCMKALQEQRFDDAETSAKQAVEIAEKIQPTDGRLPEAVGSLATVYGRRGNLDKSFELFKRQLALVQKLNGPQHPAVLIPVQNLAMVAAQQKNFPEAEKYFGLALEIGERSYGIESSTYSQQLLGLAHIYMLEQNYAKSESAILRALNIFEKTYSDASPEMAIPVTALCYLYDQWDKPEKSAPCHARLVSMIERQFGSSSPYLLRELPAEAAALRKLGRNDEADKLEQRSQSLQSAQVNPN